MVRSRCGNSVPIAGILQNSYSVIMARVREFVPQEAIQGAMNVFWRSGYDDTTTPAR